jgi:glycosyltransferase involved in cell wall biosynthesis
VISVVLPTYNGARWLREAVDSVLAQTERELELIVVVDGSTDDTDAILRGYDDARLIVERTANQGLPRALNTGFARARGQYLSWTSDDNVYLPDAMRVMRAYLEQHARAAMVCTDCQLIDERGRAAGYDETTWACFLYRAQAARATGEYRPELRLVEDIDFFLRLKHFAGPIERIAGAHYQYRVHRGSLSHTQLGKRQLASLKMHYDLITRGIEQGDVRALFFERMTVAAALREWETFDAIVAFGREHGVAFQGELDARARHLRTRHGWLVNRARVFVRGRWKNARARLRGLWKR